jgi:hypothetical protein
VKKYPTKKMAKDMIRYFTKEEMDLWMEHRHMKSYSHNQPSGKYTLKP